MAETWMSDVPLKALLVCDGRQDGRALPDTITEGGSIDCQQIEVSELDATLQRLTGGGLDLVCLDLARSTTHLANAVARLRERAPGVPVLVLPEMWNGHETADILHRAVVRGQSRDGWNRTRVLQSLRSILRRQHAHGELLRMVLMDDLTGLHNRRGFRVLADEYIKSANGTKKSLLLFMADLDGLKQINDTFGHGEGDRALLRAAQSFSATFRTSDITARLGGDEFAALMIEGYGRSADSVCRRLQRNVAQHAARETRYRLSLSVGVVRFDAHTVHSLQEVVGRADNELYRQKRCKRALAIAAAEPHGRIAETPQPQLCNSAL